MTRIRFDHIAIGMSRMVDATEMLVGTLGGVPAYGQPSGVFRWGSWTFEGGGTIEILEPMGDHGFLHRFLDERGPGVHHVTFKVPSLDEVTNRAERAGYDVVGRDDSDPDWKEAFLHPKQALGIVVQFAESVGGDDEPSAHWQPPPGPPDPPAPVAIVGLRLRAHSRERARRQWETVLEGRPSEGPEGELIYRWPDSPMRLAIEIDPTRDEGPLAIDLVSDRAIALPDGPHPALGTVFRRVRVSPA
jgi:catechol 2,3-dioxygenase-like lactoylglutathione lyase family enzyme